MATGFEITKVWMNTTPELLEEIVNFWESRQMLPPGTNAQERAKQVVLVIRSRGKMVGLSTAELVRFHQLNDNLFYNFRMIVLHELRIPGIESKVTVETRDLLEAYAATQSENKAIGFMTIVANPHLMEKRNEAIWPASKMVYIGNDKQGRHIRVYYFKGANI